MSSIHEVHEPFSEILLVHAAWDVGGGGACIERISLNGSRFISHPGENVKIDSAPGNNFFVRDVTVRPLTSLEAARARRRRQAKVPAAGRGDEHAPRDLARRPAGCSQKTPRLGSERKSPGSENKIFMTSPGSWPSRLVWRFSTTGRGSRCGSPGALKISPIDPNAQAGDHAGDAFVFTWFRPFVSFGHDAPARLERERPVQR